MHPDFFRSDRGRGAVTMPVTVALAGAGASQSSRLGGYGSLFQRASIITGFAWLTAVSAGGRNPACAYGPGFTLHD